LDFAERSNTSARASLAASAAAAFASSSTVLLPSAMLRPPAEAPRTQHNGANQSGDVSIAAGTGNGQLRRRSKKL
jgi:hypothetical protein